MKNQAVFVPASEAKSRGSTLAVAVTVVLVILAASFVLGEGPRVDLRNQMVTLPFVRRDVAAVSLLSAMPLAWLLSKFVTPRMQSIPCIALGLILLLAAWRIFFRVMHVDSLLSEIHSYGTLDRIAMASVLAIGITLCMSAFDRRAIPKVQTSELSTCMLRSLCAALVLILIPVTYQNACCRYEARQVTELLEQSRIGDARYRLDRLLALDFNYQHHGELIRRELSDLKTTVSILSKRCESELSRTATIDARIERARELAMLGRVEQASATLYATGVAESNADVCGLLAIISENQNQWEAALTLYLNCQALWHATPKESRRSDGIYAAIRGTAYCCRKLGRLQQAEDEWLKLLALSPTADTHFLLAQFYEDIQHTAKAHLYAAKAAELSPSSYRDKAEALTKKMRQLHFGCLQLHESGGLRHASGRTK